jgi:hypothetical protein
MNSSPTAFPNGARSFIQCMMTLSSLGLLSACEAQKPAGAAASPAPVTEGRKYSEPTLIGIVIDGETKRPLQGVIVYGHYATASGSLGGGTVPGELVKSFETETDVNGNFKLDAWDTGDRVVVNGEPRGRFPAIALYKPGYGLEMQGLNSIKEFYPRSMVKTVIKAEMTDTVVDWTKVPFEMRPLKTEKERYTALSNLNYPMRMAGECGWESYSKVLLAQHNELKGWYQRNLPADQLSSTGYPKPNAQIPDEFRVLSIVFETGVDRILSRNAASAQTWKCADPTLKFGNKK